MRNKTISQPPEDGSRMEIFQMVIFLLHWNKFSHQSGFPENSGTGEPKLTHSSGNIRFKKQRERQKTCRWRQMADIKYITMTWCLVCWLFLVNSKNKTSLLQAVRWQYSFFNQHVGHPKKSSRPLNGSFLLGDTPREPLATRFCASVLHISSHSQTAGIILQNPRMAL